MKFGLQRVSIWVNIQKKFQVPRSHSIGEKCDANFKLSSHFSRKVCDRGTWNLVCKEYPYRLICDREYEKGSYPIFWKFWVIHINGKLTSRRSFWCYWRKDLSVRCWVTAVFSQKIHKINFRDINDFSYLHVFRIFTSYLVISNRPCDGLLGFEQLVYKLFMASFEFSRHINATFLLKMFLTFILIF